MFPRLVIAGLAGSLVLYAAVRIAGGGDSLRQLVFRGTALLGEEPNLAAYSTEQLLSDAEQKVDEVKSFQDRGSDEEPEVFGDFFVEACKRANDRQLDRLVAIYARLNPGSMEKSKLLPPLANSLIGREVASLRWGRRTLKLPEAKTAIPDNVKATSKDVVAAWLSFMATEELYLAEFPRKEAKDQIDGEGNAKSFYRLIDAALAGQNRLESEISQYGVGGANCLNMTDVYDAQDIANLLMLMRERRLELAVGAAIRVAGASGAMSAPEEVTEPIIEFLKQEGLDWENLFAGKVADDFAKGWGVIDRQPLLEALVSYGSDRGGLMVNYLVRMIEPRWQRRLAELLGLMIQGSGKENTRISTSSGTYTSRRGPAFSPDVQRFSLETVEQMAAAEMEDYEARPILSVLGRARSATSIPALQRFIKHPSQDVADEAAEILRAMGQPAPAVPQGDVVFEVLVNGQKLPGGMRLSWGIGIPERISQSSFFSTDEDGTFKISHRTFRRWAGKGQAQVGIAGSYGSEGAAAFYVTIPAPGDAETLRQVNVQAVQLEIHLENLEHLNSAFDHRVKMELSTPASPDRENHSRGFAETKEFQVDSSIVLPSVQVGTWELSLFTNGAARWRDNIEVGPGLQVVTAELQPGSDLRFKVKLPNGETSRFFPAQWDPKLGIHVT